MALNLTAKSNNSGYRITGGNPVTGDITCLGAKNFITKAMVASLLGNTPTTLTNVPPIGDTEITMDMMNAVGIDITYDVDDKIMQIDPSKIKMASIPLPHSGSNRIPILLLGTLLHRFKEVKVPILGGCNIGERKVNFHLDAIEKFGGEVEGTDEGYIARRKGPLLGTRIELPYPSVGATETCLYLAVLAEGRTVISNAAIEPEIFELITMLRSMGAVIFTTSGRDIHIEGVQSLNGTKMEILGDRIEAASWASLACASDGEILVKGIRPSTLGNFLSYFRQVGGGFDLVAPDAIRFYRRSALRSTHLETDVYPGFSTDWQQPFAILLTQADGVSIIHETVYEDRFGYLRELSYFGAKTQLTHNCLGSVECRFRDQNYDHSAIIFGRTPFHAVDQIEIPDLRAGLAYVISAAIANGTSVLTGIKNVERGYGDIVPRLDRMNLSIERVTLETV
jgi:UDP-N-acetylglucosamine 1-carboxyvinyltransferase